jgi:hypothetical protein
LPVLLLARPTLSLIALQTVPRFGSLPGPLLFVFLFLPGLGLRPPSRFLAIEVGVRRLDAPEFQAGSLDLEVLPGVRGGVES